MVFDEASSWWPPNKDVFPDLNVSKDYLRSSQIQLWYGEFNVADDEGATQSPWQTSVHQQLGEVGEPNRFPCTPVLQGHKFIRKNYGAVKSTSDFADGNKIKGTLGNIKDISER